MHLLWNISVYLTLNWYKCLQNVLVSHIKPKVCNVCVMVYVTLENKCIVVQ